MALFAILPLPRAAADVPSFAHAAVAADHPLAGEAGAEMLRRGGNVVDAAVAASFALSVVRPGSCGMGGGGFMLIWNAEKQTAVALDYRETAPAKATRTMYTAAESPHPFPSRDGGLAIAVPGNVAGLCYALKHYGTLDLPTVLGPALRYAREGIVVDPHQRDVQATMLARFREQPKWRSRFANLYRLYLNDGEPWPEGARFFSPQRKLLEVLEQGGADGFYAHAAPTFAKTIADAGGIVTTEDFKAVRPKVREPLMGEFRGRKLLVMPPPSSGGIAMLETLNILAAYEQQHSDFTLENSGHNRPATVHVVTEAMKHAFADRAAYLGDADFADVPVERLISRDYATALAKKIDPRRTRAAEAYGRFQPVDDSGTSHFSVMDARGNAVACTETVNTLFGSMVVDAEYGIVFNNEMDDFAAEPGKPNAFKLIQSDANAVATGKKPLSSMSPTIVLEDGKARFALGASGGPRIISSTTRVLLNLMCFDMLPTEAVAQPRFHHQWLPDELLIEPPLFARATAELGGYGHRARRGDKLAVTQAIARTPRGLQAASDLRKGGAPAGH